MAKTGTEVFDKLVAAGDHRGAAIELVRMSRPAPTHVDLCMSYALGVRSG